MKDVVYWQKSQAREVWQQIIESTHCIRGNDAIIRKATNSLLRHRIVHTE
jgi:hypothetical protein